MDQKNNIPKGKPSQAPSQDAQVHGRVTHPFKLKFKQGHDKAGFELSKVFPYPVDKIVIMCVGKNTFRLFAQFPDGYKEPIVKAPPLKKDKKLSTT